MKLTVPGNLLVAGEYLILDEGGPGLSLAVEPRAVAEARPAGSWFVEALMGGERMLWRPGDSAPPLVGAMFKTADIMLGSMGVHAQPHALSIDTGTFYYKDGRKTGFGSSAAAAVALALLIGRSAGLSGEALQSFALKAAHDGHRLSQGGRGSGYDVYTSFHGGAGLFTGGRLPAWQALDGYPLPPALLFPGLQAVSSSEAVRRFRTWREHSNGEASYLLDASKSAVLRLAAATDSSSFFLALKDAAEAGIQVGDAMEAPARLQAPPGVEGAVVKASGAGDELGIAFLPPGYPPVNIPGTQPLIPAGGPRWLS